MLLHYAPPPVIIGISGAAGAGKSFLAQHLAQTYGFRRFAFADPLKDMLRVILADFGFAPQQMTRWIEGDWKEDPCPALYGQSCRHALQTLGTEWGREMVHKNLWTGLLMARIAECPLVVVDDVRMDNEAEALLRYSADARIYRVIPQGDPVRHPGSHASERGIDRSLITADIVHNFTPASLAGEVSAKIATPLALREIPVGSTLALRGS